MLHQVINFTLLESSILNETKGALFEKICINILKWAFYILIMISAISRIDMEDGNGFLIKDIYGHLGKNLSENSAYVLNEWHLTQPRYFLGSCHFFMVELFAKIVNSLKRLTIFGKKLYHRCLEES